MRNTKPLLTWSHCNPSIPRRSADARTHAHKHLQRAGDLRRRIENAKSYYFNLEKKRAKIIIIIIITMIIIKKNNSDDKRGKNKTITESDSAPSIPSSLPGVPRRI